MIKPEAIVPDAEYSAKDAAALLDVSRSTLHRYVRSGLLRARYRKTRIRPYFLGRDIISCLSRL